jgi:hypothetical protein
MRKIDTDRPMETSTPVTGDIVEMLAKLAKWKPKTLEQVITACERLKHAANEEIFYGNSRADNGEKRSFFESLVGKMVKYPNGVANSTEYLYVTKVDITELDLDTTAKLTGMRLSKYNRIGNDTVQEYTLPILYSAIVDMKVQGFTVMRHGFKVTYSVVNTQAEYLDAVMRMRTIAEKAMAIPDYLARGSVKISLRKSRFTRGTRNDDNNVETTKGEGQCQNQPTSTTTTRAASRSPRAPADTTSSSPATTAMASRKSRVSETSRRNVSRKSPRSSSSS